MHAHDDGDCGDDRRILHQRLERVEDRLSKVEEVAARVPALESYVGRMEKLIHDMQLDIRRMERSNTAAMEALKRAQQDSTALLAGKVDQLLALLQPKAVL
jgi:hypothetical protein